MKTRKSLFSLLTLLVFASLLAACGGAATTQAPPATEMPATEMPATEAPAGNMDALIAAAKEEGTLTTIALPHDWCNYGEVIDGFKAKYGLEVNELNPDAGSGDEVEAIKANKDNKGPQAPDVIDVGFAFGDSSKKDQLIQPYKVSTWDTIPDDAKDADGYWYGDYYGVLSFLVNTDVQPDVPKDWATCWIRNTMDRSRSQAIRALPIRPSNLCLQPRSQTAVRWMMPNPDLITLPS